ncbi:MAG TPA: hypothetical protein VFM15_07150, partial [Gammaproteobacteria bacterium]|nr:hypothetical protein [Gammaproteobacteria bacterium]
MLRKLLVMLSAALLTACATHSSSVTPSAPASQPAAASAVQGSDVLRTTLDNGLRVVIVKNT